MSDKNTEIQQLFAMASKISRDKLEAETKEKEKQVIKIPVVEETIQVNNSLPDTYVGTSSLSLSSSDIQMETGFLDKLKIDHSKYTNLTFTKEQAYRINKGVNKLSAGTAAVVPLICKRKSMFI